MKTILIFLIFLIPILVTAQENDITEKVTHKGIHRNFIVHLPNGKSDNGPYPVVFVLHGGGGNGSQVMKYTGFNAVADKENFIAVYPSGYKHSWADGRGITKADKASVDDLDFFLGLIGFISHKYPVDSKRIYACGISNGGFMCQRVACELSNRFAAVASICASLGKNHNCTPKQKISVMLMNGTNDPLVPYAGGFVHLGKMMRGECLGTEETIAWWVNQLGCSDDFEKFPVEDKVADQTSAEHRVYVSAGETGPRIELVKIINGGHTWPGKKQYLDEKYIGKTCRDFDGNEMIWNFFKKCSRP